MVDESFETRTVGALADDFAAKVVALVAEAGARLEQYGKALLFLQLPDGEKKRRFFGPGFLAHRAAFFAELCQIEPVVDELDGVPGYPLEMGLVVCGAGCCELGVLDLLVEHHRGNVDVVGVRSQAVRRVEQPGCRHCDDRRAVGKVCVNVIHVFFSEHFRGDHPRRRSGRSS